MTTGIAFSLYSLGLVFCALRFFRAFTNPGEPQSKSRVGTLLANHLLFASLTLGSLGLGSLFFARNSAALFAILLFSHIPLTLATALGVYLIFYIFSPKISPWPVTIGAIILGVIVMVSTIVVHPLPHLIASGIDWDMPRWLSMLLFNLLFLEVGSEIYIFSRLFLHASSREVKRLSFGLVALGLITVINNGIRFVFLLIEAPDLQARTYDLVAASTGVGFITIFFIIPTVASWVSKRRIERISNGI